MSRDTDLSAGGKASWRLWGFVPSVFTDVRPRPWATGVTWTMTAIYGLNPKPDQLSRILERQAADFYRRVLAGVSVGDRELAARLTRYQLDWDEGAGKLTPGIVQASLAKVWADNRNGGAFQQQAAYDAYFAERVAQAQRRWGSAWAEAMSAARDFVEGDSGG